MENKIIKPLALEIDEAVCELNAAVNQISQNHNLPCYLLEMIVAEVLSKLQNGKRIEIENARRSYELQLKEADKNE